MEILMFLVFLIVILVLFQRLAELGRKIRLLTQKVHALEIALYVQEETSVSPSGKAATPSPMTEQPVPTEAPPQPAIKIPSQPSTDSEQKEPSKKTAPYPKTTSYPKTQKPSRTREEWEMLIGGKLLNRIAALALIIGMGFFLQYAFEHNWINEVMRVGIGATMGVLLLAGGARFHKKDMAVFAQGLIGAGTAIFYLTIFAAFNFYHLVSQPVAFVLMSGITVLTFSQAIRYNALSISLLGWAGGFLTPFLLSTGQANETGLFTYILVLDIGLLAVLLKKRSWMILEPFTIGATYLIFMVWYDQFYSDSVYFPTILFLSLFWGIFFAVRVYQDHRMPAKSLLFPLMCGGMNALLFFIFLCATTDTLYHHALAIIILALGMIYSAAALVLRRRTDATGIFRQNILMAIILLATATAIEYSGLRLITLWSLEGILLLWCAERWNIVLIRWSALSLTGIAVITLLCTEASWNYFSFAPSFLPALNERALAFLVLAVAFFLHTVLLRRVEGRQKLIVSASHIAWMLLLFLLCTVENNDYFSRIVSHQDSTTYAQLAFMHNLRLTVFWGVYAMLLVWFGRKYAVMQGLYVGLGILLIALLWGSIYGSSYIPIEHYAPVFNIRVAVFVLLLSTVSTIIHQISMQKFRWTTDLVRTLQIILALLIFEALTVETYDYFARAIALARLSTNTLPEKISSLTNLQQLALSGAWLLYSVILMATGLIRRSRGLRMMSIVLFGITILKVFIFDLSFLPTLYRIFSFIGLAIILFAVSYFYQRYKDIIFETPAEQTPEQDVPYPLV